MSANESHSVAHVERDRIAFFDILHEGFQRAAANCAVVEQRVNIAGFIVRLCFAGDTLVSKIAPALQHLHCDQTLHEDLTICLWDSASTEAGLPLLASSLVEYLRLRWWEQLDIRREVKGYNDERIHTLFHLGPDILSVLDLQRNLGLYWVPDAAALPYYEQGYPLTALLSWWLDAHGRQLVHAASIGFDWGAALLPGKGGSGKSSTALACLDSDLRILGDDYCVIARQPSPRVHSLYNTSKLKAAEDVARFAQFEHMISNPERSGEEKALIFLHEHASDRLLRESPLSVILLPRITGRVDTTLHPASAAAALRYLAPSTMFQLPGNAERAFREAVALTRQLPVFELGLGTDIRQIPEVIARALHSTRQVTRDD
jgi:hypothetical protein